MIPSLQTVGYVAPCTTDVLEFLDSVLRMVLLWELGRVEKEWLWQCPCKRNEQNLVSVFWKLFFWTLPKNG